MPVIDLKDYLGMPQQAPAQPVFQATTQNVDPMALRAADPYSSDAFLANVEARQRLAGLQRLAPVFQAQQAQLAYDQVAEQARQLRQKQEIEAQVQRATEEITQGAIDPESDQFNQQALQFYGRNQLAFLDPRMKEAMNFLSNQNQQYEASRRARAEAEIKTQEDTRRRYLSALEGGELMPQEIPAGATQEQLAFLQGRAKRRKEETELERKQREAAEQDRKSAMAWAGKRGVPTDLVNLMPDSASIYQLGSAYGGARGTSAAGGPVIKFYENKLQALKAQADALSARADETDDDKARETLLKQASDASQQFIDTNAEFIQKLDELNVTGGGAAAGAAPAFTLPNYPYSREFRADFEAATGGVPAAVGGQFTVPGLTPPPAGGAAAPAPTPTGNERIQIQPPIETKQSLMSVAPTNRNESFYKRLLGRTDLTPEERTATETEFKSFIQQAPPTEGAASSILDVRTRPERTKAREEAVLKVSKEAEDQRKWVEAWEASKNQVRSAIQKIADETGHSPQEVMESLRRGERVRFKVGDRNLSLEQWLGKLLGAEQYYDVPLLGVPKSFSPWKTDSLVQDVVAGMRGRSPPIWKGVLDNTLQESQANQNTVAPASPNASVSGVPKIQIGTPIQTTR